MVIHNIYDEAAGINWAIRKNDEIVEALSLLLRFRETLRSMKNMKFGKVMLRRIFAGKKWTNKKDVRMQTAMNFETFIFELTRSRLLKWLGYKVGMERNRFWKICDRECPCWEK
ncbi:hypothetical protein HHI36_019780 [Cryptolaemus montrouzieri]|uniref:Uncharacterized protein n=1 Tax=Cryptolaemus montrouzieri TaxID=559131 RepID=A0ABD2N927_9CUCU